MKRIGDKKPGKAAKAAAKKKKNTVKVARVGGALSSALNNAAKNGATKDPYSGGGSGNARRTLSSEEGWASLKYKRDAYNAGDKKSSNISKRSKKHY